MLSIKVVRVTPLTDMNLDVLFENGITKRFSVEPLLKDYPEFALLHKNKNEAFGSMT